MSEQTTGTIADTGASDPSMEDILASIRRIIADDAADDADGAEDNSTAEVSEAVEDAADITSLTQNQEDDITDTEMDSLDVDLDFDDILIMDDEAFSAEDLEIPNAEAFAGSDDDVTALNVGDDDSLDAEILEILESAEVGATQNLTVENAPDVSDIVTADIAEVKSDEVAITTMPEGSAASSDADVDDDLMSLLEGDMDLVLEMDEAVDFSDGSDEDEPESTVTVDVATVETTETDDMELIDSLLDENTEAFSADEAALEDLIAENKAETEPEEAHTDADDDLDLVKSLMADLTDDDLSDDDAGAVQSDETDLVDDILELTMDDQTSEFSSEAAAPVEPVTGEAESLQDLDLEDDDVESVDASLNALLEIAASAEEDATTVAAVDVTAAETSKDTGEGELTNEPSGDDLDVFADLDIDLTDTGLDLDQALLEVENSLDKAQAEISGTEVEQSGLADDTADDLETVSGFDTEDEIDLDEILLESDGDPLENLLDETDSDVGTDEALKAPDDTLATSALPETDTGAAADESVQAPETFSEIIPKQEKPDMPQLVARDTILDEVTEDATTAAFASLNQVVEDKAVLAERGPRVGDIVQDALRPMLKEWLDENLKGIVERAVAKEVKRISSGK